jgi:hypothetical protein
VSDVEVSLAPEEPYVDLVAMALDIFGDMLTDVSVEAEESRSWECWVGPGHQPVHRADGTAYAEPATPPRSAGPVGPRRRPAPS